MEEDNKIGKIILIFLSIIFIISLLLVFTESKILYEEQDNFLIEQENNSLVNEIVYYEESVSDSFLNNCKVMDDVIYTLPNDEGKSWNYSVIKDGEFIIGEISVGVSVAGEGVDITLTSYNESQEDSIYIIEGEEVDAKDCYDSFELFNYTRTQNNVNKSWLQENALCTIFCDGDDFTLNECYDEFKSKKTIGNNPRWENCKQWYFEGHLIENKPEKVLRW